MTVQNPVPRGSARALATAAAALAGGVLAVPFWDATLFIRILIVVLSAVLATAAALALTAAPRRRVLPASTAPPGPAAPWYPSQPTPRTPDVPREVPRQVPVEAPPQAPRVVLPLPGSQPGDAGGWWDRTAPAPAPAPAVAVPLRTAPSAEPSPLREYTADAALIAHCPRCGGFALDVAFGGPDYRFGCRSCANTWRWTPGTPWPPVTLRHDRRGPGADRT